MIDSIYPDVAANVESTYYNSVCPPRQNDLNYSNAFFNFFGPRDLCATQESGEQWRTQAENELEKLLLDDCLASNQDGKVRHNWSLKYIPGRGICTSTIVTLQNKKGTQLPPRYYSSVEQSPQKRRIHIRTIGQRSGCFTFESRVSLGEGTHNRILKRKRVSACKSLFGNDNTKNTSTTKETKYKVKVTHCSSNTMPTTNFQSPNHYKVVETNISPAREMKICHGIIYQQSVTKSKFLKRNFTWKKLIESTELGNCVDLPPRYLHGSTRSPQKRRIHSTTFGSISRSFSFQSI